MDLRKFLTIFVLAVVFIISLPDRTESAPIAYINAAGGSVDYLAGYGHVVTYFNDPVGLTLADLAGFDALLIASNQVFSEAVNIGNVAGAFADAGGGVVLTEFDFQGQWALGGQIMTPGYSPFTVDPLSDGYFLSSNLGVIVDPGSPLFAGVNTANVHTQFQAAVDLDPGASLVASWDSLRLAIAFNTLSNSSVVGLNLFPDATYTSDPDTQRLVANALQFSIDNQVDQVPIPEPTTVTLVGIGTLALIRRRAKSKFRRT